MTFGTYRRRFDKKFFTIAFLYRQLHTFNLLDVSAPNIETIDDDSLQILKRKSAFQYDANEFTHGSVRQRVFHVDVVIYHHWSSVIQFQKWVIEFALLSRLSLIL